MNTWIIGAGGLLGHALTTSVKDTFAATPINWGDPDLSVDQLTQNLKQFVSIVEPQSLPWSIIWAAGHATVSSDADTCQRELEVFTRFTQSLAEIDTRGNGTFFLTSSAGGVYAGSAPAPFSVESAVAPTSEYGHLKLAQEQTALQLDHWNVRIGRVSNLYGPGQDLNKLQGLVSRLVLAALEKETINIFVPLDTLRDFIYVQDAADTISELVHNPESPQIAIIASGEPKSLGTVIHQVQEIIRIKIPIAYGIHSSSAGQSPDLRMVPTVASPNSTPFPVGVKHVIADLVDRLQNR